MVEAENAFAPDKTLCAFKIAREHIPLTLCFAYHVFNLLYYLDRHADIHLYLPLATLKRINFSPSAPVE